MSARGVEVTASPSDAGSSILSPEAVEFITHLVRRFRPGLETLMHKRVIQQERYDAGEKPHFLPETQHVRDGDWKVRPISNYLFSSQNSFCGLRFLYKSLYECCIIHIMCLQQDVCGKGVKCENLTEICQSLMIFNSMFFGMTRLFASSLDTMSCNERKGYKGTYVWHMKRAL